jgi:hypothetical protein
MSEIETELAAAKEQIAALKKENCRARVQIPLWKGVASAMVERAKRIRCQFGGDHSIADCRCDPHQLGDAIYTMQDELDRASKGDNREKYAQIAVLTQERDALAAALDKYGDHLSNCSARVVMYNACDCGFDDSAAKLRAGVKE